MIIYNAVANGLLTISPDLTNLYFTFLFSEYVAKVDSQVFEPFNSFR